MQRLLLIVALALAALVAGAMLYDARRPVVSSSPAIDTRPPDSAVDAVTMGPVYPSFQLADVDGVLHDFSEWHGQHRLLNFWATWCAPCRREIPLLKAFQDEQGSNGIQVIGIAVDFPEPVARYAEAAEFNYPILVGEQDAMAVAESSGVPFIGLPFTMIVAADGELIATHLGEIHQEHLDKIGTIFGQLDRGDIDRDAAGSALGLF